MVTLYQAIGQYFAQKTKEHYVDHPEEIGIVQQKVNAVTQSGTGVLLLNEESRTSLRLQYGIKGLTQKAQDVWVYQAGESVDLPESQWTKGMKDSPLNNLVGGLGDTMNSIREILVRLNPRDKIVQKLQKRLAQQGIKKFKFYLLREGIKEEMPTEQDYLEHVSEVAGSIGSGVGPDVAAKLVQLFTLAPDNKEMAENLGEKIKLLELEVALTRAKQVDVPLIYGD